MENTKAWLQLLYYCISMRIQGVRRALSHQNQDKRKADYII